MGASSYKHEIKTLFLVINSCIALTIGLFPLSVGLGIVLSGAPEPAIVTLGTLVVGTLTLGLAALGHYGAFVEKRAVLRVYGAVLGLATFAQVIAVMKFSGLPGDTLVFGIFHIAVMLFAMTLAMVLAKLTRWTYPDPVQPAALAATAPAPAPTAPTVL